MLPRITCPPLSLSSLPPFLPPYFSSFSSFHPPFLPLSQSVHLLLSLCRLLSLAFLCHLLSFTLSGNQLLLSIPDVANDTDEGVRMREHECEWTEDECVWSRWVSAHTKTCVFLHHSRSDIRILSLFATGPLSLSLFTESNWVHCVFQVYTHIYI